VPRGPARHQVQLGAYLVCRHRVIEQRAENSRLTSPEQVRPLGPGTADPLQRVGEAPNADLDKGLEAVAKRVQPQLTRRGNGWAHKREGSGSTTHPSADMHYGAVLVFRDPDKVQFEFIAPPLDARTSQP
jgi:hypothetical protein